MLKFSTQYSKNLRRAGWLLVLEVGVACVLAYFSVKTNITLSYIFIAMWLTNLVTSWCISKAATDLGKNSVLFGVVSALLPAFAVSAWYWLKFVELWQRLELPDSQRDGEA